jgi:hypothetical protein
MVMPLWEMLHALGNNVRMDIVIQCIQPKTNLELKEALKSIHAPSNVEYHLGILVNRGILTRSKTTSALYTYSTNFEVICQLSDELKQQIIPLCYLLERNTKDETLAHTSN